MPDEDKNFDGSLVLDLRKWWRHAKTIYENQMLNFSKKIWSSFLPKNEAEQHHQQQQQQQIQQVSCKAWRCLCHETNLSKRKL